MKGFFVTGTDTGVGKTLISVALIHMLKRRGLRVSGYKPVASGADMTHQGLRNEDGVALLRASNVALGYSAVNPYCFAAPIAPHLAAKDAGVPIDDKRLLAQFHSLSVAGDAVVVEGAGGWRVPLNEFADIASLARDIGLPVVLVAAIRLGCLNHTLLTADAILASGVPLAGWVANRVDINDIHSLAMIESLKVRIAAPCFGIVPELRGSLDAQAYLTLPS